MTEETSEKFHIQTYPHDTGVPEQYKSLLGKFYWGSEDSGQSPDCFPFASIEEAFADILKFAKAHHIHIFNVHVCADALTM